MGQGFESLQARQVWWIWRSWLACQVVALEVVGSSPTIHPISAVWKQTDRTARAVESEGDGCAGCRALYWGVAKRLRHKTLTLAGAGSNPAAPARFDPLAQSAEHLTFNQGVWSSSLQWVTIRNCGRGGMADAPDLGSGARVAYEFESLRPHHCPRVCGSSSVGRAPPCQGGGRESESRLPLQICGCNSMVERQPSKLDTWVRFPSPAPTKFAVVAQLVERHLAKVEVASPSLVYRSKAFPRGVLFA